MPVTGNWLFLDFLCSVSVEEGGGDADAVLVRMDLTCGIGDDGCCECYLPTIVANLCHKLVQLQKGNQ
jgi:hypothetical protein